MRKQKRAGEDRVGKDRKGKGRKGQNTRQRKATKTGRATNWTIYATVGKFFSGGKPVLVFIFYICLGENLINHINH